MSATAKELTPAQVEQRHKVAFALDARVKEAISHGRVALWELAEALYEFNEERGWAPLGYDSLGAWLADPEIGMTSTTYFRYTKVWRDLVVKRDLGVERLKALDPSKIDIVLPSVNAGTTLVDEALDDVEALGARDLREKYAGARDPAKDDDGADDDVIEGTATPNGGSPPVETIEVAVIEPEPPTKDEWDEILERAKSRKRGPVKYILEMTSWRAADSMEPEPNRLSWTVPYRAELRALVNELNGVVESGQAMPRVDATILRAGLEAIEGLELLP